ncbi:MULTISPECIES: patatin-like phospholipase family protein [Candidatus Accumulibacter]|uniref:NTE family protein RssA n=2 Tax=Candidatus Accumulibacter TaxID=327159 RepID=A0A080M617_9PROT|nr:MULTISPECIES: patatin-like phospholipase family protein [Candidatus Accumulibacter]KFB76436.1 MAG: NTE family protein RssA [Candidatus Accumulibacter cognatus]MBL8402111.1 patatin-like phospholipase family protein [Accumulibacter sp.]MCC2867164.1 patatin-like phospholipase family protein [Candidatus Accumulibacter phosphatis]TMQ77461.1 putative patatin-like phospholipase [Candidatus Accumulibacter phosphatis]
MNAMPHRHLLLVLLAAGMLANASADDQNPVRPRVGLVLGGGGARGAAHIGVLEVLEKMRVPVDCVAGTSMGGLVAGAYAAGLKPAMMRTELAKADWDDLFQDDPPYSQRSFRKKALDKRFLPASETGVGADGLKYQTGVVTGQKIKLFFNQLVGDYYGEREIATLPLPLSIIATDIVRGEQVVFREGSLTTAMRASMSVPGLMSPVEARGYKLVDGGLVNNVPIDEVRSRCQADIVIAVNVGSPLLKANDISGLLSVATQMVNILTEQNVTRSLATLKPTDIYIKPDLEGVSAGDFKSTSETADRGVTAAEAIAERLRPLAVSEAAYAAWAGKIQMARREIPRIHEIQIAGLKRVNPAMVEQHIEVRPGDTVDPARIDADLLRTYGDGFYEHVDYAMLTERQRNILRVTPLEKSWGPDYLRYGINLDTNFKADSTYNLRIAYHKTWLNSLGGELLTYGEIGSNNGVVFDYYQPVDERQRYFVETNLRYGSKLSSIYQDNHKLAGYQVLEGSAKFGGGINLGTLGQVRAGWDEKWWNPRLDTGVPLLPDVSKRYGGWFSRIDFEQTDRLYFPTSGWRSAVEYFDSPANHFSKLDAGASVFHSLGDWVLSSRLSYQGSPVGQLPIYDSGSLGGMLNMTAFAVGQLKGDNIRYGNLRAERIIGHLPLGLRGDMRLGFAFEGAKVGTPYTETNLKGWINSTAIYLGGETPLGPVYLGYGYSTSGSKGGYSNFYLFLGTP